MRWGCLARTGPSKDFTNSPHYVHIPPPLYIFSLKKMFVICSVIIWHQSNRTCDSIWVIVKSHYCMIWTYSVMDVLTQLSRAFLAPPFHFSLISFLLASELNCPPSPRETVTGLSRPILSILPNCALSDSNWRVFSSIYKIEKCP